MVGQDGDDELLSVCRRCATARLSCVGGGAWLVAVCVSKLHRSRRSGSTKGLPEYAGDAGRCARCVCGSRGGHGLTCGAAAVEADSVDSVEAAGRVRNARARR